MVLREMFISAIFQYVKCSMQRKSPGGTTGEFIAYPYRSQNSPIRRTASSGMNLRRSTMLHDSAASMKASPPT